MAKLFASAALLLLFAAHQAAAWNSASGCQDVIIGETGPFGVVGEAKPMKFVNHTEHWKKTGQITKINLFYSWNHGCLQGLKATYGYKAADAKLIGHEKNLYTQDLKLADYEHIHRFDVKQQTNKCIEYIKLYTDKNKTLAFGNAKSTAQIRTVIAPAGSFLAAFAGEFDIETKDGKQVNGGLQNVRMMWAKEVCPAGEVPKPPSQPEAPAPVDGPEQPEQPETPAVPVPVPAVPEVPVTPEVPTTPETPDTPVCPPMPAMCDSGAAEGSVPFCPVTSPFTAPKCEGGCCVSSGKCKMPLCKLNGLGADVMALDFICYGKNVGPFGGLNKCRNLACKLHVNGCQSGLLGGNCVGTVVAVNDNLDAMAKQYIGKPCIEVLNFPGPLHMPLNKPGLPVPNGEYMGGLWSVCDCYATPSPVLPAVPFFDIKKHLLGAKLSLFSSLIAGKPEGECNGPLCALLPQLPVMNATLPDLQIPMTLLANITSLLKPKPLDLPDFAGMIPAIQLPELEITISALTLPPLPTFEQCVGYFVNVTNMLKPAIEAVLPTPQPMNKADLIRIVSDLLPQIRFELPALDVSAMPKLQLPDLTNLVAALLPKIPQFKAIELNFPTIKLPEKLKFNISFPVLSGAAKTKKL